MPTTKHRLVLFSKKDKRDTKTLLDIIVLVANTGFRVSKEVLKEMRTIKRITGVNSKDLYSFFQELMLSEKPSDGIILMKNTRFMKLLLPEFIPCIGCQQNEKFHQDDVFTHCIKACDVAEKDFSVRTAALLHDIGKAYVKTSKKVYLFSCVACGAKQKSNIKHYKGCKCGSKNAFLKIVETEQKFHKHEVKSDTMSKKILKRLGVPKEQGLFIANLIRNHMYMYDREWTDKAVRRFIAKTKMKKGNLENISRFPLFLVREADRMSRGLEPRTEKQGDFEERIIKWFHQGMC